MGQDGQPDALQGVTAAADKDKAHCLHLPLERAVGGNGATKPRMGHLDWGNYNAATNTM